MASTFDTAISLGTRCQSKFHLRRLDLSPHSGPFDWGNTNHKALIHCLDCKFESVMREHICVRCRKSGMETIHNIPDLSPVVAWHEHAIQNFAAAQDKRVLFLRSADGPRDAFGANDYDEVHAALGRYGFKDFELRFVASVETWASAPAVVKNNPKIYFTKHPFYAPGDPKNWNGYESDYNRVLMDLLGATKMV